MFSLVGTKIWYNREWSHEVEGPFVIEKIIEDDGIVLKLKFEGIDIDHRIASDRIFFSEEAAYSAVAKELERARVEIEHKQATINKILEGLAHGNRDKT